MTLTAEEAGQVPEETALLMKRMHPKGHPLQTLRDRLGPIYRDSDFADLFSGRGRPAESPARLALILVLAYREGLSDEAAAKAVEDRISWRYLLGLPLTGVGFAPSILTTFRERLITGGAERRLFDRLLEECRTVGLVRGATPTRTDSTHILADLRELNRLELVGETLRQTLGALAHHAPDWLRARVPARWGEAYGRRIQKYRLPRGQSQRQTLAETIGQDGVTLLGWMEEPETPVSVRDHPAVVTLRAVWLQQFVSTEQRLLLRDADNLPPSHLRIVSPVDVTARAATKRELTWLGYKAHFSETCADEDVHLVTDVTTTAATTPDETVVASIQANLMAAGVTPAPHLVDSGYVTGSTMVQSARREIFLLGPARPDASWQTRTPDAFTIDQFLIDWGQQQVTCPVGKVSKAWSPLPSDNRAAWKVRFATAACAVCPDRPRCTTQASGPRILKLPDQETWQLLTDRRREQTTETFQTEYAKRAGVEGLMDLVANDYRGRRSRYRGFPKVTLHNLLLGVAINIDRLIDWWEQDDPHATPKTKTISWHQRLGMAA